MGTNLSIPPYSIRESPRAKRVILRISAHGRVEVVVPHGFNPKKVDQIVKGKKAWIEKTLKKIKKPGTESGPSPSLPESIALTAVDKVVAVLYQPQETNSLKLLYSGDSIVRIVGRVGQADVCRFLLRKWLRHQGRIYLLPWLEETGSRLGLSYQRAQVRGQKSKWGSCSSRGTVSLNFKLLFLSKELAQYVLIHELVHTRHLNHSRSFWDLVAQYEPNYRKREAELKRAGAYVPAWVD